MKGVWEQTEARAKTSAVLERLQKGDTLPTVASDLRLEPAGLIAALAQAGLGDEDAAGAPPLVHGSPKRPWLRRALDEGAWSELVPHASRTSRLALAAGLLQIHDFWEDSHEAAQQADDLGERAVSAYWHGIAHRREPDAGNASYWFRRVGRHSLFGPLGAAAQAILQSHGDPKLTGRLTPGGTWSPFAFIEFCGEARRDRGIEGLAKTLQRLEMIALLGPTAEAAIADR
ncbi:MAG: hypothetical protein P4L84_10765 [Isosphaeraceae bacterium]|nr:hypothetical protein [Isosphaeraceae bacterium]